MSTNIDNESQLRRGTGAALGPYFARFPFEERSLVHVLRYQARTRPTTDWLVFNSDERLTFAQAERLVYRVAEAAVQRAGAAPHIALFLRNQVEFMPAFLGAQAAGGLAVPLNAELKGPLLGTMLNKAEATLLIARIDLLEHVEAQANLGAVRLIVACGTGPVPTSVKGVPVITWEEFLRGHPGAEPANLPLPTDLGALMFTSGTSGGSKAVMCTNHYLYFFPACVADALELTTEDVLSTPLQICHVAALHNFADAGLHAGTTVHLKTYFSASSYWDEIAADGATFTMLMGQMASMVLRACPNAPAHRLRHAYILPQPVERVEFEKRYNVKVIWNGFGQTEIFPHLPNRHPDDSLLADAIGLAPTWLDWGVVDENDRMVKSGVLGQLVYRPLLPFAMASGYYKDGDATSKAFSNLIYHTGDLGYYDDRGIVHFSMRNQDAIRRRGENISAVELERIALTFAGVLDAAAYAVPAEFGEHEVKLDLIASDDLDLRKFHAELTKQLPRYMVPRYLERRASFPKTISQRTEKYKLMKEPLDRSEVLVFEATRRTES